MKAIEVKSISKKYGEVQAIKDISFSVEKGSICAILGPNGSGKTTTIKSICNLIMPDQGEIMIMGKNNRKSSKHIAALFEGTRNLYWRLTPKENLKYFAGIRGLGGKKIDQEIDMLLEKFNLGDKKNVTVNELSRGMKQKVAIAMTMICNTDIILLDEPTLGLDVQSFIEIKEILLDLAKNMNKTILLSTHDMSLVQDVCEKVVIINKGNIIAKDSMDNLLDMFKSKTYEVRVQDPESVELMENYSQSRFEFFSTDNKKVLEVDIHKPEDINEIIDILKSKEILIEEIKLKEINFERVYLDLTKEEVSA